MRTTNQRQSRSRDLSQFDDPICAPQAKIFSENSSETSISFQKCVRNSKKLFAPIGAKCILKSRNKILKSREIWQKSLKSRDETRHPPSPGGGSIFYKVISKNKKFSTINEMFLSNNHPRNFLLVSYELGVFSCANDNNITS